MKIRNILFLFMGLLLVTSCTFRLSKEDKDTMSQTLSVKPFEKVDVIGAYEVIYRQDTFYNVRVEGPAYCVKRMRVTSDGTTLSICKKSRSNIDEFLFNMEDFDTTVRVYVTSPDLIGVNTFDSASFEAAGLIDTDNLTLKMYNSSDIELGNVLCDNLMLSQYNSSDAEIGQITTQELKIDSYNSSATEIKSMEAREATLQTFNSSDIDITSKLCQRLHAGACNSSIIEVRGKVLQHTQNASNSAEVNIYN